MNRDKFKIPVAEIESGTFIKLSDMKASELDLGNISAKELKNISAEVNLKTTTIGITANFVVSFDAVYECVRCLEVFAKKSISELLLVYSEGQDPLWEQDSIKLKSQDTERIYYTGPCIDLRSGIREAIILAISIVALCDDNCPGLCPVCGKKKGASTCVCKPISKGIFTPKDSKRSTKT